MSEEEVKACDVFMCRLKNVIDAARGSGVTFSEILGSLEIMKLDIYQEMLGDEEDVQPE